MKTRQYISYTKVLASTAIVSVLAAACVDEPDQSNRYTFTGETIESLIAKDSALTSFNYILGRVRLDKTLSTYGRTTCFAPCNDGVARYVDSLYNDTKAHIPHNGMSENSLEGLSDSLCREIANYHLAAGKLMLMNMGGSQSTMLGRPFSVSVNADGQTVINGKAVITQQDIGTTNGIVHKLSDVIPLESKLLPDVLADEKEFGIFAEAVRLTGLNDSLYAARKNKTYTIGDHNDTAGNSLYWPDECRVGYTILAETDATLAANGIKSIDDLIKYAAEVYGNADAWYDYPKEKGIRISTGTDYTNRFNTLNMFVAYHILRASMAQDRLIYENGANGNGNPAVTKWNYVNGGEAQDYYETMLPHTLVKIWKPEPGNTVYLNRYQTFNTLTNEVGTMGTNHTLVNPGIAVVRKDIIAYNGYMHPIGGMLTYNRQVPEGVLNERMRFDSSAFLEELVNNGFRYMLMDEVSAINGGGNGERIAFPLNYFDDVVCINNGTLLRYNVKGRYYSHEADSFNGWGDYDVVVKMPPLPTGIYEFRTNYGSIAHGGMMQYYYGISPNPQEMKPLGIPYDVRIPADDPRIGWGLFWEEDDRGIASDEAMRNRGYMRGPYSYTGKPGEGGDPATTGSGRGSNQSMRVILGRIEVKQSEYIWLRIKNVLKDERDLKWAVDFVEFVPISVVDNEQYSEDWF